MLSVEETPVADTEAARDPAGISEAAVEFNRELTYDDALNVIQVLMSRLIRLRDQRPYLRLRWEMRQLVFVQLTGRSGEMRLRQRLAALISNQFNDFSSRLIRRFSWGAPVEPATRYLRVVHLRQSITEEGPQSQYVRHFDEAVTLLIELAPGLDLWPDENGRIQADLAARMQGNPEQFEVRRWQRIETASS